MIMLSRARPSSKSGNGRQLYDMLVGMWSPADFWDASQWQPNGTQNSERNYATGKAMKDKSVDKSRLVSSTSDFSCSDSLSGKQIRWQHPLAAWPRDRLKPPQNAEIHTQNQPTLTNHAVHYRYTGLPVLTDIHAYEMHTSTQTSAACTVLVSASLLVIMLVVVHDMQQHQYQRM